MRGRALRGSVALRTASRGTQRTSFFIYTTGQTCLEGLRTPGRRGLMRWPGCISTAQRLFYIQFPFLPLGPTQMSTSGQTWLLPVGFCRHDAQMLLFFPPKINSCELSLWKNNWKLDTVVASLWENGRPEQKGAMICIVYALGLSEL